MDQQTRNALDSIKAHEKQMERERQRFQEEQKSLKKREIWEAIGGALMIGIIIFLIWAIVFKSDVLFDYYSDETSEDVSDAHMLNAMVNLCAEAIRTEDFKPGSVLNKEQQAALSYQMASALTTLDNPKEHLRKCIENDY